MKIDIMDKSFEMLKSYENSFTKLFPQAQMKYVTNCGDLEKSIDMDLPNMVIIDVDNPHGILSAKRIKEKYNMIKIVITSMSDKQALEAYQNGYGFLKKPFDDDSIKKIMDN